MLTALGARHALQSRAAYALSTGQRRALIHSLVFKSNIPDVHIPNQSVTEYVLQVCAVGGGGGIGVVGRNLGVGARVNVNVGLRVWVMVWVWMGE